MSARSVDHSLVAITGYTDRLSAYPGEVVSVHASSTHKSGSMKLVRLGHDGKRCAMEPVAAEIPIELAHREVVLGSYGIVDKVEFPAAPLALRVWVCMSLEPNARDGNATLLATDGLTLSISRACRLVLAVGGYVVISTTALQLGRWYHVTGGLQADGRAFVSIRPQRPGFGEAQVERVLGSSQAFWKPHAGALVIGRGFDGKLEEVSIGRSHGDEPSDDVLGLDFARGISSWRLHDSRGAVVGRVLGLPMRGVTGRRWDGSQYDWRYARDHYAAIHFHTDDQGDQQWPVTTTVTLPDDLPVGVYAVELRAAGDVDHLPFVVRRRHGPPAPLLLLLPTVTYLAYAHEHNPDEAIEATAGWRIETRERCADFARANGYHSFYDRHADGVPVVLGSLHRPLLNIRPDHQYRLSRCEHNLSADLHLVGWLARQGVAFDLATDHDLDAEGIELLAPYRGLMTGNHPEYCSARMLSALETYLDSGGSLAYLGGNGFWWATVIDPSDPSVMELRRGYTWGGRAGEGHFQLNGLPGGLWDACGRRPAVMLGVAWGCVGMEGGVPYQRTTASFDPRVVHLFAGIGNEPIGERGAFLGAAASIEVDSAHPLLGTPAHALVIATAAMPAGYKESPLPLVCNVENDSGRLRADIVYFETRGGGAVFSVGSMGWIGALSQDNDCNAASRLTANVLRAFADRDHSMSLQHGTNRDARKPL